MHEEVLIYNRVITLLFICFRLFLIQQQILNPFKTKSEAHKAILMRYINNETGNRGERMAFLRVKAKLSSWPPPVSFFMISLDGQQDELSLASQPQLFPYVIPAMSTQTAFLRLKQTPPQTPPKRRSGSASVLSQHRIR